MGQISTLTFFASLQTSLRVVIGRETIVRFPVRRGLRRHFGSIGDLYSRALIPCDFAWPQSEPTICGC
jgi:hypothetical protein